VPIMKTVEQVLDGGQHVAIPQASANIEGMAPRRRCHTAIGAGVSRTARSARSTERNGEHRLLQIGAKRAGWPKSPRALTGRLRQAQTLLRALAIERVFGREGR
jgi:hypothetical protein